MVVKRSGEIRVPVAATQSILGHVWRPGREEVAFALVRHVPTPEGVAVLVRDVELLQDDERIDTAGFAAAWSSATTSRIAKSAIAAGCGVLVVHAHFGYGSAFLSGPDRSSGEAIARRLQMLTPDQVHGTLVIGEASADALLWVPGCAEPVATSRIKWMNEYVRLWPLPSTRDWDEDKSDTYASQEPVFGSVGERRLRAATVAVIGLGGGGSHVVQQLAHLGVKTVVGIDHDTVERRNLSRLIGARAGDALAKVPKVRVAARLVRSINPKVRFHGIREEVPSAKTISAIRGADVVVACPDKWKVRSEVLEICQRAVVPMVSIGLDVVLDDGVTSETPPPRIDMIGGHVFSYLPGRHCLWCAGLLTTERLEGEARESYVRGAINSAPQVISFNGLLASAATNAVLALLTGYNVRQSTFDWRYFGLSNELFDNSSVTASKPICNRCRQLVAAS